MRGETVKFTTAQQAKPYNIYKNTNLKLLKKIPLYGSIRYAGTTLCDLNTSALWIDNTF